MRRHHMGHHGLCLVLTGSLPPWRAAGRQGRERIKTASTGVQEGRPLGWPWPERVEVHVLTSSSGASALTNEERLAPYRALGQRLQGIPWPLPPPACLKQRK